MAGDREIAMTHRDADRGADGVLRAFYNVCKHRGHELLASAGTKCQIACPYHGWVYALDGRLHRARHSERIENFDASAISLTFVQVEVFCHLVFVNLDGEAPPLAEQMEGDAAPAPGVVVFHRHDVTSEESAAELMTRVEREHGRLDVLVNAAGISPEFLSCSFRQRDLVDNHRKRERVCGRVSRGRDGRPGGLSNAGYARRLPTIPFSPYRRSLTYAGGWRRGTHSAAHCRGPGRAWA